MITLLKVWRYDILILKKRKLGGTRAKMNSSRGTTRDVKVWRYDILILKKRKLGGTRAKMNSSRGTTHQRVY